MDLWYYFNLAWIAIFTKQIDILHSGQEMNQNCGLISREYIRDMGDGLVEMCDGIAGHGLVDYECGVLENEIMTGTSHSSARTTIN
jgi:hypothetical protein